MSVLTTSRRAVSLGGAALLWGLGSGAARAQSFSEGYQFLQAVIAQDAVAAERILSISGSAIHAREPSTGAGALHIVARHQDLPWLDFLLQRGARPDMQSNTGDTPLFICARNGWLDGAMRLLAARAGPDVATNRGETPLIAAVWNRDSQMVQLLLSAGADPDRDDSAGGHSALDYARQDPRAAPLLGLLESARRRSREAPGTRPAGTGSMSPERPATTLGEGLETPQR